MSEVERSKTLQELDGEDWGEPELRAETARMAQQALSLLPGLDETDRPTAQDSFTNAYDIFQSAEYFAQHGRT
jgi:hypothetical protein